MRIGELAGRTGVTRRALRYYEAHGLLPAHRTSNGYREYDEMSARRVRNIRRLQGAGFTAEEILEFVPCLDGTLPATCPASERTIARKLALVQEELDGLTAIRDGLAAMLPGADRAAAPA